MTLYRITLRLCSPLATPLKGDTIWGHIAWGIANHEGDEGIGEFLSREKSGDPSLVVSSAFPTGMLCRPIPEPQERTKSGLSAEEYAKIKLNKKLKYLAAADYVSGVAEMSGDEAGSFKAVPVLHNTIDRSSNAVLEGGLYMVQEEWAGTADWDIYVLSSDPAERVQELCEWAFENGYGADASTGKGKILVKNSPEPVEARKTGSVYMALGPFVKESNTIITDLRGDIFIRSGRLGGDFASIVVPYKKTVLLYDAGAVFTSEKRLGYVGKILPNVHMDPRICQSAFTPVIPIA
ncbi:conserved hypothetical protein [Treponema primitia ZAS-2]|uniref:CRISPR system Cms protein Csm4 n=1 Tax=Treponema primitia (strain ATCC BAA-887 / DSM 12427 / ZAS-2) TaxID=545694 RepID=F5YHA8_TREPZ|nr:hypothetical protein [Treponema primitia]AEF86157.1 conserved hypothetical protein [Treponema primitia ZAS-2]